MVLIEEKKRMFGNGNIIPFTEVQNSKEVLAASEHRVRTTHGKLGRLKSSEDRCFICVRIGHIMRERTFTKMLAIAMTATLYGITVKTGLREVKV